MNVERSLHLVGVKLSKAMIEAHEKGLVDSETLLESAECILVINRLTDAADSNKTRDINPLKSALSTENVESRAVLEDFLSWAPTLKVLGKNDCMKTLHCFNGLEMTIRGLLELYDNVSWKLPSFQLCTRLCTTDSIEMLFARFRARGGFNPNPTCYMLQLIIRHMLSVKQHRIFSKS
ncbi:uncharacterized protein LOC117180691 [Belonocnema kinseyi]|uniref:uncharacterized protein LOC117180691 n=1 Tax=Belonocnema kinseyi TaxID=2817044 RepID=UPI00143CF161|nr:uncharacterized protein LOC117180691 [Belonocnema kinseyi]